MDERALGEIRIRMKAAGNAIGIDHLMFDTYAKKMGESGFADPIGERLALGIKAYVYGGDDDEIVLSFPDGPLERFKARHHWARRLLGPVRMFRRELQVTSFYPDLESRLHPRGIGSSVTLRVDGGERPVGVNIIRRTESELAEFRHKAAMHGVSREDQDKFLDGLGVRIL